jgi:hypothetical protein
VTHQNPKKRFQFFLLHEKKDETHGDIELWKKLKYFSIFIVMTAIKQINRHTPDTQKNQNGYYYYYHNQYYRRRRRRDHRDHSQRTSQNVGGRF